MPRCPACHRRIPEDGACPTHASALFGPPGAAGSASLEQPSVPGFQVGRLLGRGGFALVWEAAREEDGALVAIKVGRADHPVAHERFRRDADVLRRVGPPHVPRFYQIGRLDDGRPFIVMERLFGSTLAGALETAPSALDIRWVLSIADSALAALEVVHACGLLHRDIKPENIHLCSSSQRVALIDFGLTRSGLGGEQDSLTRTGAAVGTPEYMSPEQIRGERALDARTDIYSFGVVLFELLTLRLPFVGDRHSIEHGHQALRPPRPRDIVPLPERLSEVTLACLEKEPARRPPTAAFLRRALSEISPTVEAGSEAALEAAGPSSNSRPSSESHLASARRPVVLLVLEGVGSSAAQITAEIVRRKGVVARQQGGRYVCVFSGEDVDSPARVAALTAKNLSARHGCRAALHLATLMARRDPRGFLRVYGAALEKPESWLPAADWTDVLLTPELSQALPAGDVRAAPGHIGFFAFEPGDVFSVSHNVQAEPSLLGRADVLAAILASMKRSFSRRAPALFTLLGEHGTGKSRLVREALSMAPTLHPDVDAIPLKAEQVFATSGDGGMREMVARILDVDAAVIESNPERALRERLGDEVVEGAWPAIAWLYGKPATNADGAASGALRLGLMRAIAEALRRRARKRPVVLALDDAHWADDALLDALEYATLDAPGHSLWVLVAAHPRLEAARRQWGSRANRHDRAVLGPLDEETGMRLAGELLLPADYPPADVLRRLWGSSGGNPACLVELIRTLKKTGIVRKRAEPGGYYVATAELEELPPMAAWQWIASRALDAMPPELALCLRFYSVLGVDFSRAEIDLVQGALERAGGAGASLDTGYALGALVDRGVLRREAGDRCRFQSAVLQDSIYRLLDARQREEVHRRALEVWRSSVDLAANTEERLQRIARHASACGARAEAAEAHLTLGDGSRLQHRHVEADQHYTAALGLFEEDDAERRATALAGRGRVRYRVHRIPEALDDLTSARELFARLGDDARQADLLLEEATVLDLADDFTASAVKVQQARPLVEQLEDAHLELRLLASLGRSCFRFGRTAEAIDLLERVAGSAKAAGDYETRIIALLLLSPSLGYMGRLDEAEERYEEVLTLCAAAGDLLHLGAAYANRAVLWISRTRPERAAEDLRRAVKLAREVGNFRAESNATYNVAEFLHWLGEEEEALTLAERVLVLEERFAERPSPAPSLLLARIQAARGDFEEARRLLDQASESCPPDAWDPVMEAFLCALRFVVGDGEGAASDQDGSKDLWADIVSKIGMGSLTEELIEILHWRAWTAVRAGRWAEALSTLESADQYLKERPMWLPRWSELWARARRREAGPSAPT